jgi:hypothetical protein
MINPENVVKGVSNVVTGVLDNISSGKPLDISGNLSRGIKTVLSTGEPTPQNVDKSVLGSTGGGNLYEQASKSELPNNQATSSRIRDFSDVNTSLNRGINNNVANLRPVVWNDRTRGMDERVTGPHFRLQSLARDLPSSPAGLPAREISSTGINNISRIGANTDVMSGNPARDFYGYKPIPNLKIKKAKKKKQLKKRR